MTDVEVFVGDGNLAFLASNAISGAYEIVRHSRNKLLERKKQELRN